MKPYCFIISILLCFCSCQKKSKGSLNKLIVSKTKNKHVSWKQIFDDAQKDHEIYGAFDVSEDSIVLLRRSYGIESSSNRGKTWNWLAKEIFRIDEFTVDDKGIWWGLERWKGIHEPRYCFIHFSIDAGKTWKHFKLNTSKFFPYHICSKPRQPLEINEYWSKKIYRHSGENPFTNWKFIAKLQNHDNDVVDISAGNYFVRHGDYHDKLYVKRKNGSADTLMSFIKASAIYSIKKNTDEVYVAGPSTRNQCSYFAVFRHEHLLKEITVPGGDLSITITQYGHIYLTGMSGAYQYKNEKLTQLFK